MHKYIHNFLYYALATISLIVIHTHTKQWTSQDSLYPLVEPTERMFTWINTFMDKKNPIPYRTSVSELKTIIQLFHTHLDACGINNALEHDIHTLVSYQLTKLQRIHTVLAHKNAHNSSSFTLGFKLAQVCQLPDLVKELDSSLLHLVKKAYTTDAKAAHDLEQFYLDSFRPFYRKWHNKSSWFFLEALSSRLSY